jgi:Reverse transcriptase (RNA-dependent DNA polymerase)
MPINYGIGQGTNLGPLIFSIFISDLMSLELFSKSQFYADDGVFIFNAPTYQILKNLMISDLETISEWLIRNKLSLNTAKTKFMIFYQCFSKADPLFNDLSFSHGRISRVDCFNYLGLSVDSCLTFQSHVRKVISKIKPYVGILSRLRYYLPTKSLKLIYYSYIHSNIIYLLPAYGSCVRVHLDELEMLHKRSLKCIFKLRFDHPTLEVYNKGISDLYTMIKHEMVLLLYKIKNNQIKSNFSLITRGDVSGRVTRQSTNFNITFSHLTYIKESFFGRGFQIFNELPESIKNEKSIARFKRLSLEKLKPFPSIL